MTGTGFNNGEDLQIVRYEPGQFYKVHHDQNTAVWAPQGPRVLTFFMYLNTPEGGGETWFPQARADDLARSPLDLGEAWLRWVAECAVKHAHGATPPPPGCSSRPLSRGGSGTGSPPPPPSQVRGVDGSQGVMVQPKLGSAILWPSTLDQQPMDADHRTNHEARAVTQGIKYGSNMWIHQARSPPISADLRLTSSLSPPGLARSAPICPDPHAPVRLQDAVGARVPAHVRQHYGRGAPRPTPPRVGHCCPSSSPPRPRRSPCRRPATRSTRSWWRVMFPSTQAAEEHASGERRDVQTERCAVGMVCPAGEWHGLFCV